MSDPGFTHIPGAVTEAWIAQKETTTRNLQQLAVSTGDAESFDHLKRYQLVAMLFQMELARKDFAGKCRDDKRDGKSTSYEGALRKVAGFLVLWSLHCGRLWVAVDKQKDIVEETGVGKNHVSAALTWLVQHLVFFYEEKLVDRADGRKIRRQIWKPNLNTEQWIIRDRFPLTADKITRITKLYNPDEQFELQFGDNPKLGDILNQLILSGSGPAGPAVVGTKRGVARFELDTPRLDKDTMARGSQPGASSVNRNGPPDLQSGGSAAQIQSADGGSSGNGKLSPNDSVDTGESLPPIKSFADGVAIMRAVIARTGGFFGTQKATSHTLPGKDREPSKVVPPGGTIAGNATIATEQPTKNAEKSSDSRNFPAEEFRRDGTSSQMVPTPKSSDESSKIEAIPAPEAGGNEFPRARVPGTGGTIPSTSNTVPFRDTVSSKKGTENPPAPPEGQWRKARTTRDEWLLLQRIAEVVGKEDVSIYHNLWVARFIRKFPAERIHRAVNDTLDAMKRGEVDIPHAYLKHQIETNFYTEAPKR